MDVSNLGLPLAGENAVALDGGRFSQYVEPTRDGDPWCDWPDAEDMLVKAAWRVMRGPEGLKPSAYRLTRDADATTLTLELTGE